MNEAKKDKEDNQPIKDCTYTWCGDYCQNLDLPHFGNEQPGDTYYFSPLTVNVFGIADHSNDLLNAYVYTEATGKKGGNNVVSLIYKKLKDDKFLEEAQTGGPFKELILIFDNCCGQNKNKMVMRFCQWLIDKEIFKMIEVVFLICGHTKNICDRRFKDLKHNFHNANIYTFEDLLVHLSTNNEKLVKVFAPKEEEFFNWTAFEDMYYVKKIDRISEWHWFMFCVDNEGEVKVRYTFPEDFSEESQLLYGLKKCK